MDSLKDVQRERLFFLEFLALFTGRISRKDLVSRFGISEPAATKDLSLYANLAPDVLRYDIREKTYLLSKGKTIFDHDMEQSLYSLSGTRAIAIDSSHAERLPNWINSSVKRIVPIELVSAITRSIYQNHQIKAVYFSINSGNKSRILSPLALVHDGLRWHIRCFDHDKNRFADFNLTRFTSAKIIGASDASLKTDPEWNKEVKLSLIPHPNLQHPETVKMDFDMEEDCKEITLRTCLVGYFLRHWHIDYSVSATGNPKAQQLYLNNRKELLKSGVSEWALRD